MNWKAVTYPSFLNFHDVTIESELIHVTAPVDLNLAAIHFAKWSFCSGNHRNSLKELHKFVKKKAPPLTSMSPRKKLERAK